MDNNIIDVIEIFENDMGERLEVEIEKNVMGKTCHFYYTTYDINGNERRTKTRSIAYDYLSGNTF